MLSKKSFLSRCKRLQHIASQLPHTRTMALAKIEALVRLNMGWEAIQLDRNLTSPPFELAHRLVEQAICELNICRQIAFCDGGLPVSTSTTFVDGEAEHHDLFQALWIEFSASAYTERIERYDQRLAFNKLNSGFFNDMQIIDMGCGHGNFAHALLNAGAKFVLGIDFGEQTIAYAQAAQIRLKIPSSQLSFSVASVYAVPQPDGIFDAAVQNGVFHHLAHEDRAYQEMFRLLKPGGWAWIYTEGAGSIARELWDISVEILADIPASLVQEHLKHLGFSINKRYHLGDGLKAVYHATTYENLTQRLTKMGFGEFRRLVGGFETDLDITAADPWAAEKFGEGDIRLLARKLKTRA